MDSTQDTEARESMPQEFQGPEEFDPAPEDDFLRETFEVEGDELTYDE